MIFYFVTKSVRWHMNRLWQDFKVVYLSKISPVNIQRGGGGCLLLAFRSKQQRRKPLLTRSLSSFSSPFIQSGSRNEGGRRKEKISLCSLCYRGHTNISPSLGRRGRGPPALKRCFLYVHNDQVSEKEALLFSLLCVGRTERTEGDHYTATAP